jgi:hypothetical protein
MSTRCAGANAAPAARIVAAFDVPTLGKKKLMLKATKIITTYVINLRIRNLIWANRVDFLYSLGYLGEVGVLDGPRLLRNTAATATMIMTRTTIAAIVNVDELPEVDVLVELLELDAIVLGATVVVGLVVIGGGLEVVVVGVVAIVLDVDIVEVEETAGVDDDAIVLLDVDCTAGCRAASSSGLKWR